MLYLTDTRKETGALRVIPGSHTVPYQQQLKALQGYHGVHTYHPLWAEVRTTTNYLFSLSRACLDKSSCFIL